MQPHRQFQLAALMGLAAILTGCASVGAPLPPSLELIKPPTDLRATRKGDRVFLSWAVPTRTMDHQTVRHRGPTLICRGLEVAMSECGTPVGSVPPGAVAQNSAVSKTNSKTSSRTQATYVDQLPKDLIDSGLHRGPSRGLLQTVTYAVEPLNSSARAAGLSNQVQVLMAPTLPPPADFHAELTSTGVKLTWKGELLSLPLSAVHYFYRVYRRQAGSEEHTVVGSVERGFDAHPALVDQTFAWEKHYEYWINVVTVVQADSHSCTNGNSAGACVEQVEIEGDDSPFQSVFTHDTFPPAVPSGLQAVFSGPGQKAFIDLIWAPDTEADLTGYNVYRHEAGTQPARVNTDLVKSPAYRDADVASGRTYFYSVSAVDGAGNESARSEETSEQVP